MSARHRIQHDPHIGQYYVQIQRDGARRKFWLGTGLKDARQRLRDVERDIEGGRIEFVKETTSATTADGRRDIQVAELVIRHLEWVKARRALGTFKLRQHYAFLFLEFLNLGRMVDDRFEISGTCCVSELTRSRLTDFHIWARKRGSATPNAGNQALRHAKTILLWGVDEELCELPFRKFPKMHEVPAKTKRVDLADLAKLLEAAPADLVDIVTFGLMTGLRPQELRDLTTDHIVKPAEGPWYVRIERHKTAGRTNNTIVRTVPLCDQAREILERQTAAHPKSKTIFVNSDGTPYTRSVFRRRLVRWCRHVGIPDITPYALRHTFASVESDAHVESTALARLMGHSTVRTLSRYVSNSTAHDMAAVQAVQTALSQARGRTV